MMGDFQLISHVTSHILTLSVQFISIASVTIYLNNPKTTDSTVTWAVFEYGFSSFHFHLKPKGPTSIQWGPQNNSFGTNSMFYILPSALVNPC